MPEFGLVIWVNDTPLSGNIIKLSSISEPRKPLEAYEVGDEVKAKCHGFHGVTFPAVIGKIGEKKAMENILRGDGFAELVTALKIKQSGDRTDPEPEPTKKPGTVTKGKTESTKKKRKKERSAEKENPRKKPAKKINLKEVANDLILTEIQAEKENPRKKPAKKINLKEVANDLILTEIQEEVHKSLDLGDTADLLETTRHLLQSENAGTDGMHAIQPEKEPGKGCIKEKKDASPSPSPSWRIREYEKRIALLEQKQMHASSKMADLEKNVNLLWEIVNKQQNNGERQVWDAMMTDAGPKQDLYSQVQPTATSDTSHQHQLQQNLYGSQEQTLIGGCSMVQPTASSSISHQHQLPQNLYGSQEQTSFGGCSMVQPTDYDGTSHQLFGSHEQTLIGGYSMAQLENKIRGLKSYSKAAAKLFRCLYRESEYVGRSLTGKYRDGKLKPAVDQVRLHGIYKLITSMYPDATESMVRKSLADLLKPSRFNKCE